MSKLNQTNTIFTIFKELSIKLLTWHYETSHKSILVKVKLAHNYGISKTNLSHACFDTQNSLDYPSDKITKVYFKKNFSVFLFLLLSSLKLSS
jgi:hypothetical protein